MDIDKARELDDERYIDREATYTQEEYSKLEERIEELESDLDKARQDILTFKDNSGDYVELEFEDVLDTYDKLCNAEELKMDIIKTLITFKNDIKEYEKKGTNYNQISTGAVGVKINALLDKLGAKENEKV